MRLARVGPVTNTMVRERTGLSRSRALALLSDLVAAGLLVRRGARRGTNYVAAARKESAGDGEERQGVLEL